MKKILLKSKENFNAVAGTTVEKFFAAIQQNFPWPFGLRQISPLALSKCWPVEPLRAAHSFARIDDICSQRNRVINGGRV